jgi:hypothetical protein
MTPKKPDGRKYSTRSTPDELARRHRECAALLGAYARPSEIKRLMVEKYGVDSRSVDAYMTAARKIMLEDIGASKEEMRAIAFAQISAILKDKNTRTVDRLEAHKILIQMLGLNAPTRIAATDANGNDIPQQPQSQPQLLLTDGPQSESQYVPPKPLSLEDARAAMRLLKSELGIPSGVVIETPRKTTATPPPGQEMTISTQ